MGMFEAEDVEDYDGPELPEQGTPEYRKLILTIAASEDPRNYNEAMRPLFEQRGWRAAVDVMVELLGNLAVNCPPWAIDAFGNVKLQEVVHVMSEDDKLSYVSENARKIHPGKPIHEAMRSTMAYADRIVSTSAELLPVWEQAATVLRRETREAVEEARVILTRWLNKHKGDRVKTGAFGASVTHAHLRRLALPPGDAWVPDLVDLRPRLSDIPGSVAWARIGPNVHTANDTYGLAATLPAPAEGSAPKRPRRCPGCGRVHRLR